MQRKSFVLCKK